MRAVVINRDFHFGKKWVSPANWYFTNGLIDKLGCKIISSQEEYDEIAEDLDWVFINQPGWSAPWIKYRKGMKHKLAMVISDPHDKVDWLPQYVIDNDVDYLLCFYWQASLKFLPTIDSNKFIFFPWYIPDELCVNDINADAKTDSLMIFGSMDHDAYRTRRWCCDFPFVTRYNRSLANIGDIPYEEYLSWLSSFGAIVCAGSWDYPFVFPKFYETAGAGGLLFGQAVDDMDLVGFNNTNCVMFTENNFEALAKSYLTNPGKYDNIRRNGLKLIKERHLVSQRLKEVETLMETGIAKYRGKV